MISLIAIGLSLATIMSPEPKDLNSSDGMLTNRQHTISSSTVLMKSQRILNKKSKQLSHLTADGDRLYLDFDFYYDVVTNALVEAYFVGGYGNAKNGSSISITTTEQEGVISGDCSQFSIYFPYKYLSGGSYVTKNAFIEPTICMSY